MIDISFAHVTHLVNGVKTAVQDRADLLHQLVHPVPVTLSAASAPGDHGGEDSRCYHSAVKGLQ